MKSDALSLNNIIANILSELRKNTGLTQKEFSKTFNISTSALAHYEEGISIPPPQMLIRFSEYFKVPTDYLLGRCTYKNEYKKLNDIFCEHVTLGDMINILSELSTQDKKYLMYTISLMKNNK